MSWASMMLFMATMSAWVSRTSSQVAKFTASSSAMDFLSSAAWAATASIAATASQPIFSSFP